MNSAATPPRPRAAFRVAVTGHRWDRLPPGAAEGIRRGVTEVLRAVQRVAEEVVRDPAAGFAEGPPDLVLLTGLADGADRIAAWAALDLPGWRMHAVLPFPAAAYRCDFVGAGVPYDSLAEFGALLQRASAVTELDGHPGRYDAYAPLGRVLVDQCDLLVAVWDGGEARGPGGTANLVRQARREELPVVRGLRAGAGGVHFWLEDRDRSDEGVARGLRLLEDRVRLLLAPPPDVATAGGREDPRAAWFAEALPRPAASRMFDAVVACFHRRPGETGGRLARVVAAFRGRYTPAPTDDPGKATRAAWRAAWPPALPYDVVAGALDRFALQHGWADTLATWAGARFRGSFTTIFLLSWVAVLAAFAGALASAGAASGATFAARLVEGIVLLTILRLVRRARRDHWHERWLEYRSLAERLRHLAILWPMGRSTPLVRVPREPVAGDPRTGWVGWLLRAVTREAGLAPGRWDRGYAAACRTLLRDAELEPQRTFHRRAVERAHHVHGPLERAAERFFYAALALALFHLGLEGWHLWHGGEGEAIPSAAVRFGLTLLEGLGVALPSLAAGIHGFLGTADVEGLAIRSAAIEPRLGELVWRLDHLDALETGGVGEVAVEAARVMEGELGTWRSVTASRPLQMGG